MSNDNNKVEEASGSSVSSITGKIASFFAEIKAEFHRISWPKGKELIETTVVVLAFIVGLSVTVLVFDKVIEHTLKLVLGA